MNLLRKITALSLAFSVLTGFSACSGDQNASTAEGKPAETTTTTAITTTTTTPAPPPPPADTRVNMLAVGDNLVQTYVYKAAQAASADGVSYNFAPLYQNIKPIVQAADVAVINQETPICGGNYEITGSKFNFNSPTELGDAMVDVGFDVFTIANNHMLDKGIDGLESSINYWDGMMEKYPITVLGAYRNEEDQNRIRIQEVNGMSIAYLSYTYGMNGYQVPAGSSIRIGLNSDEALIQRQIQEAKKTADAVVVAAHWGIEDSHYVSPEVKDLAQKMINWGADVILGSHTHTAETMEYITRTDGTQGFVFYSMGNFISAQTDNFNMIGEMCTFDLVKNGETGMVTVEDVGVIPVITHYDNGNFANLRLYPYNMYTPQLAASHGLPYAPMGSAKTFNMDVVNSIIAANIPQEYQLLE